MQGKKNDALGKSTKSKIRVHVSHCMQDDLVFTKEKLLDIRLVQKAALVSSEMVEIFCKKNACVRV